jgi:hypothetical protein
MKITSCILTAMMAFMFMGASCSEKTPNFIVPGPGAGNGQVDNGGNSNNGGNNGGQQEEPASLCDPAFLGQTPMIIAYYTENSSSVPDPSGLTHINYAHGRFVDKETGDGGIWIEQPEKLNKVVKLKEQKRCCRHIF